MPGRNANTSDYRHGYQGQFTETDGETGWENFELRQYDARMARWMSTDPYYQFNSPYLAMGNNPISGVDPDGGLVEGGLAKAACAVWGAATKSSIGVVGANAFLSNIGTTFNGGGISSMQFDASMPKQTLGDFKSGQFVNFWDDASGEEVYYNFDNNDNRLFLKEVYTPGGPNSYNKGNGRTYINRQVNLIDQTNGKLTASQARHIAEQKNGGRPVILVSQNSELKGKDPRTNLPYTWDYHEYYWFSKETGVSINPTGPRTADIQTRY